MTTTDNTVIQLHAITKQYRMGEQTIRALDGIDLTVGQNEYVAITGSSGSGKSTLLNVLGCLDQPSSGTYHLAGEDVAQLPQNRLATIRNRQIGFIFQSFNLLPRATALKNVMQPLVYQKVALKDRRKRAMAALERVGLADRGDHLPNQLSGGQRQRVAVARALVTQPSILLADEPTGNLDSRTSADIMQLFARLHEQGQTLLMVTHEPEIAAHCDREIRLQDGRIIADGAPGEHHV